MKKILNIILSLVMSVSCCCSTLKAKSTVSNIVSVIAEEKVVDYARNISKKHFHAVKDDIKAYGFENEDLNSYSLGSYFTIYNYVNDSIVYEFVVLSNNKIVGFLEVNEIDGELHSSMSKAFSEEFNNLLCNFSGEYKLVTNGNDIYALTMDNIIKLYSYFDEEEVKFNNKYESVYMNDNTFLQNYDNFNDDLTPLYENELMRGSVSQPLSYKTLNVKGVSQIENTCWAATCAAIINYKKGLNLGVLDVSSFIHPNNPTGAGTDGECIRAYFNWNIVASSYGTISFSTIKNDINNNKPLHLTLTRSTLDGHMVGLIGYEDWADYDIVVLLEPNKGVRVTKTLTSSGGLSYSLNGKTYTWTRTIRLS